MLYKVFYKQLHWIKSYICRPNCQYYTYCDIDTIIHFYQTNIHIQIYIDSLDEIKIDSLKERKYKVFFILYPARLAIKGEGSSFRLYRLSQRQHIINTVNMQTHKHCYNCYKERKVLLCIYKHLYWITGLLFRSCCLCYSDSGMNMTINMYQPIIHTL